MGTRRRLAASSSLGQGACQYKQRRHVVLVPHENTCTLLRIWRVTTFALTHRMSIWSCVVEKPCNRLGIGELQRILFDGSLVVMSRKGTCTHVSHCIHEVRL